MNDERMIILKRHVNRIDNHPGIIYKEGTRKLLGAIPGLRRDAERGFIVSRVFRSPECPYIVRYRGGLQKSHTQHSGIFVP